LYSLRCKKRYAYQQALMTDSRFLAADVGVLWLLYRV